MSKPTRLSRPLTIRFPREGNFGALLRFACATTCRIASHPDGSDSVNTLPPMAFTARLSSAQSPASNAGYNYGGNWTTSTGQDFHLQDSQLASLRWWRVSAAPTHAKTPLASLRWKTTVP